MNPNVIRLLTGIIIPVGMLVSGQAHAQREPVIPVENYDITTFTGRAELIVESLAKRGGKWIGPQKAMAHFAQGNTEKGRQLIEEEIAEKIGMFPTHWLTEAWFSYHHLFGESLRQDFKEAMFNKPVGHNGVVGGATENHKLHYAVSGYLLGETWEEYPREWYEMGKKYALTWFEQVTSQSVFEYDSPTYIAYHMAPILSVARHAGDDKIRRMARMTMDWYFASLAAQYLKGEWITAPSRDKEPWYGTYFAEESSAVPWLYFGQADPPEPDVFHGREIVTNINWRQALFFALGSLDASKTGLVVPRGHRYVLPEALHGIAGDRDEPFVHREYSGVNPPTDEPYLVREPEKWPPTVHPCVYSYVCPAYGMASMQHKEAGSVVNHTRWVVKWPVHTEDKAPGTFLMKHAKADFEWELWRGISEAEQTFQHENVLLAVYDIQDENHWIDGPVFERAYEHIEERNGWVFLHAGKVLLGVHAVNGLEWGENRPPFGEAVEDDITTRVLQSRGARNGLIVQLAPVEDYEGQDAQQELDRFAGDVLKYTDIDASEIKSDRPKLTYQSLSGDKLEIRYNGIRRLNGQIMEFGDWPLLENPWMRQELNGRYLKILHGGHKLLYDFDNWVITGNRH